MLPSGSPRAAGSLLRRCALATLASVFAAAQQRPRGDGAARGRGDGAGRGVRNGRPWCDAYMQENWALAGGGFLTRDPGRWHLRPDGSRAYDVEPCRVVRYTPEDARRCLKGRHLFFMGDSVTRYQTLSLMYFLENSKWPMRLPMLARRCQPKSVASKEACSKTPNICVEGDWRNGTGAVRQRDWPNMLTHTGGSFDGGLFNGRVECLCVRDKVDTTVSNMLYRGATGVNVTFVQQMAKGNLHGWQPTNCAESGSCRSSLAKYDLAVQKARDRDYAWSAPVVRALEIPLPRFYPSVTDVIYNRGLWAPLSQKESLAIFPRLKRWAGGPRKRCFWKGTTSDGGARQIDERTTRRLATAAGCDVFDLQHVSKAFEALPFAFPVPPQSTYNNREREDVYWDMVHFMPWVYEEINNLFLNVLCNADTAWERTNPAMRGRRDDS